jgi:hypothetical protein
LADGRHASTSSRKTPAIIVGVVVLVALAAVAVFTFAGGDAIDLPDLTGEETPETPEFAFERARPMAVETAAKPNPQAATAAARAPAKAATQQLDGLYTAAFLDPANWMNGDYEDVLGFFDDEAADAAEAQLDVLTAGPSAGETFDSITPKTSSLKVRVLMAPEGAPYAVQSTARFVATGKGENGTVTFVSRGQFIFEKRDGEWRVVSFAVQRSDEDDAAGSGSASSSPSGTGEPSEAEAS